MMKMSELQEKRDYYPDRSLKSVYFVDEQGRKQGNLRKYKENSSEPEYIETYVDNKRTKIAYANGEYETFDENGNILHKKRVESFSFFETGKKIITDMSYKDEKEWTGTKEKVKLSGSMLWPVSHEKFELLEGKMHGEYKYYSVDNEKYSETAHFDNGILHGSYNCGRFPPKFLNLEKLGVNLSKIPQLCKKQGHHGMYFSGWGVINGYFDKGIFNGEVRVGANCESRRSVDSKEITYKIIDNQLAEIKYKGNTIRKYDQGNEIYRLTKNEEINQPLNGQCFKKKRWFEEINYPRGWKDTILEEWEQKDGKKHGSAKKYNEKGWLEVEAQYKNGLKHGYETKYNSDGTIASQKYYENGVNCTMVHKALKKVWNKVASKRIEKEKAIEAKTGVKTRLPKMSKGAKIAAMVKESIGLSK
ncbi:MAG: hypothetical protein IJ099_02290 [Alphaproteobacteria bacterium]|nr:hypothetical protein [Alphaproteobacteria bacterium]